ncbi:MAG: bifunctional 5,10-methylenetetrahydrofolate dehydrogenase/5,10-methenyltetrahydrofolate cyclohydrolase [Blastocatellia bacterium]|nr:bifunctional 5,10-methylenetetrahydrofolate dehydrogenase/5,10-methenyltetrahydrofolate cyclohydrolase [Blastocatellia bacterium]MBN8725111.1 bifunctional 5,10-methylenetetrahydrofolate dehydrogenase/5,10-methenyltetrahydrofolate cyclohydrolase [Acidobacteriota bacterium]
MTAKLLDGLKVAKQIKEEVAAEVKYLFESYQVKPGLAAVIVGNDPASEVYVASKVKTCETLGLYSEKHVLAKSTTTEELQELIFKLNNQDNIDGILVQMPLPKQIDADKIFASISVNKDVDGFHPENVGRLALKQTGFVACTPAGVMELLKRYDIDPAGKRAVVLGRSRIVGLPLALLLIHANATVTVCHSKTAKLKEITREADIIVAALGQTAFITTEHIKSGAIVIDVGINKLTEETEILRYFPDYTKRLEDLEKKGYTLIGDVEPDCETIAGYLTPVPGGVGPLTIAMLMKNTVKAAKLRRNL